MLSLADSVNQIIAVVQHQVMNKASLAGLLPATSTPPMENELYP